MKRRSIGERLQRAKSPEVKQEVVQAWAANWRREYEDLISQLERAVSTMDYDALCSITGQLKAVGAKAHGALPKILDALRDDSNQ